MQPGVKQPVVMVDAVNIAVVTSPDGNGRLVAIQFHLEGGMATMAHGFAPQMAKDIAFQLTQAAGFAESPRN